MDRQKILDPESIIGQYLHSTNCPADVLDAWQIIRPSAPQESGMPGDSTLSKFDEGYEDTASDGYFVYYQFHITDAADIRGALIRADLAPSVEPGALADIAAERKRQQEKEGWTIEHDDDHNDGSLAKAAACYALSGAGVKDMVAILEDHGTGVRGRSIEKVPRHWPWASNWWKPKKNKRKDLVRAGALIIAEIERLDRADLVKRGV